MSGAYSEHFGDRELACHHCHVNECQMSLVSTLEVLRLRALRWWMDREARCARDVEGYRFQAFGGLILNDAYRCPEHNAETPNAGKNSVHQLGLAADVRVYGMTAAELERLARTLPAITGIGRASSYLHIDVAPNSATVHRPAQWCYSTQPGHVGETVPYFAA